MIPRLTSAHNFEMSQGVYSFLGKLQSQGVAGNLGWDWGPFPGKFSVPAPNVPGDLAKLAGKAFLLPSAR